MSPKNSVRRIIRKVDSATKPLTTKVAHASAYPIAVVGGVAIAASYLRTSYVGVRNSQVASSKTKFEYTS